MRGLSCWQVLCRGRFNRLLVVLRGQVHQQRGFVSLRSRAAGFLRSVQWLTDSVLLPAWVFFSYAGRNRLHRLPCWQILAGQGRHKLRVVSSELFPVDTRGCPVLPVPRWAPHSLHRCHLRKRVPVAQAQLYLGLDRSRCCNAVGDHLRLQRPIPLRVFSAAASSRAGTGGRVPRAHQGYRQLGGSARREEPSQKARQEEGLRSQVKPGEGSQTRNVDEHKK